MCVGAVVLSQRRKVKGPVGPDAVLHIIAETERGVSRLPARATRLSDAEEIRIGDALAGHYGGRVWSSAPEREAEARVVTKYVERVGARVAARARRKLPYKFHYIPGMDFINAFALPGGHVFMGGGLMALMDSEDQLAAVLGHEIEHIDHYHCAERVQLEARLHKLPLGNLANLALRIPVRVFQAGYSKTQELEADREGAMLAVWATYSPLGAIRMFEAFNRVRREYLNPPKTPQEELSRVARETLEGYFKSHPDPSERIEQIRQMIADHHWENLTREQTLEVADLFRAEGAQPSSEGKR